MQNKGEVSTWAIKFRVTHPLACVEAAFHLEYFSHLYRHVKSENKATVSQTGMFNQLLKCKCFTKPIN